MTDNAAQRTSASYKLAVEDTGFLLRDEMRAIRFALEYAKAEFLLRDWGIRSTIVVFGSARIPSPEQLKSGAFGAAGQTAATRKTLAKSAVWYDRAREFGRIASERGGAITRNGGFHDNVIATGGGPGIMEAANRGAMEAGAPTIGFNITLPHEQDPNAYTTPDLTFRFHYFAMRKMHLAMRANALVVFPGGFGTMDELFELLTLQQTSKAPVMPIVLVGRDYWTKVVNFQAMVEFGTIAEADLALFEIVDTPEEAWASLVRRGLKPVGQPQKDKGRSAAKAPAPKSISRSGK